jgi:hypothetical protein
MIALVHAKHAIMDLQGIVLKLIAIAATMMMIIIIIITILWF